MARIVEALENPGAPYQHNGLDRHFPDIRFVWWAGGANFTHHQDTNRLIRAWQKPELVVAQIQLDGGGAACGYCPARYHFI